MIAASSTEGLTTGRLVLRSIVTLTGGCLSGAAYRLPAEALKQLVISTLPVVAVMAVLVVMSSPAMAQERYELSEGNWQKTEAADPNTPEGELQAIRRMLAQDKTKDARKHATRWIENYPNHPMLVEAYMLRGDARVARQDYYKSLFDYEYVIRTYPASEQFNTAIEREFEIARLFVSGMKRRLWGMRILPAFAEGEEIFIRVQERVPGSEIGEKASLALGDYYFAESRMPEAVIAYDMFLQNYPQSQHREGVLLRLIQASLATFKGPEFDSTGLLEAAQRLRQYQNEYPAAAERIGADALLVRIDESLSLKAYLTGQWFENRGRTASAALLYKRVIRDHPQTAAARQSLDRLHAMGELLEVSQPAPASTDTPASDTSVDAAVAPAQEDSRAPVTEPTTSPAGQSTAPSQQEQGK